MEDLETASQTGGFQMQLAQSPALTQLVANEQTLTIEASADRLKGRINGQGLQLWQLLPVVANPLSQGIDKGMDGRSRRHRGGKASRMVILPCSCGPLPLPLSPAPAVPVAALQPSITHLANGVPVVELEMVEAPVICLDFWSKAGSRLEQPGESGLAHFLEHMVFKGSRSLGPGEFDHQVESLGGSSNAATGFDDVHYHVLIPPDGAAQALDLLLELVLEPRLEADDFAMERQVVLEELNQSEDQPEEVVFQALLSQACPGHAYGRAILGERAALEGHQPEAMAAFHSRNYQAAHCCLALAGPLGGLGLSERLAEGSLARVSRAAAQPFPEDLKLVAGRCNLEVPRLEAARLLMAWQLPPARDHDAVIGADLLTTLLAEGRRSRLVARLREELRLVESIDLDLNVLEAGSLALLEAVCDSEKVEAVEREIRQVWQELMEHPPELAEFQRAQRLVANGYRFSLESSGSVAGLVGSHALWGRPLELDQPLESVERWTLEALHSALLPQLNPDLAFTLVALPT